MKVYPQVQGKVNIGTCLGALLTRFYGKASNEVGMEASSLTLHLAYTRSNGRD